MQTQQTTHRLQIKADLLLTGGARAGRCLRRRRAEEEQRQALDGAALACPTGRTDSRGRHRGGRDEVIRRVEQRQAPDVVVIGIDVATLAGGRRQPDVVVVFVRIILLRIVVHAAGLRRGRLHDVRRRRALLTGRGVLLQGIRVVRGPVPGPRAAVNSLSCRHALAITWGIRSGE